MRKDERERERADKAESAMAGDEEEGIEERGGGIPVFSHSILWETK